MIEEIWTTTLGLIFLFVSMGTVIVFWNCNRTLNKIALGIDRINHKLDILYDQLRNMEDRMGAKQNHRK